jgi:hypothetical protein
MGLSEINNDPNKQASIVADCAQLIDQQVSAKSGIGGMAWKTAYGAVKGVMPNYIEEVIERMLPEFLGALDPIWSEGVQTGNAVEHLNQNRSRTADALLGITDARIEKSNNGIVRGAYKQLRGSAKSEVEAAVPGIAQILGKYA